MSAPAPLTAADFQTRYDADRTFPFWEDEDGRICGYGHPDRAEAAALVTDYWCYVGDYDDASCAPSDVHHRWAVRLPDTEDGDPAIVWADAIGPHTQETPGAFPIWTAAL